MLDLLHVYARLHGPRAVRVIQNALTEEAGRRADGAASADNDAENGMEAAYGTSPVPPLDEYANGNHRGPLV